MKKLLVSLLPQAILMLLWRQDTEPMQYTLIFGTSNEGGLRLAQAPNALKALAMIERLQRSDEEIRSIQSLQEGEIGVEMLRVLAREEEEELPVAAS
jgi:hypothetical protein